MIDIKNMARSTKRRVTSRLSTETDVEESLLASSRPSALRDVVLPDPDKAKPVRLATEADEEKASTAAAADEPERKGGSPWLMIAAAVVLLGGGGAAAWYATQRGGDSDEAASAAGEATIAQADTTAAAAGGETPDLVEPEQPEPGAIATDDDGDEDGEPGAGDTADPNEATPAPAAEPEPDEADRKPDKKDKDRKVARAERRGKTSDKRRPEAKKDDEAKDEPKKVADVGPAGDLDSLLDKAAGEKRGKKEEKKEEDTSSAPKGKNKLTRAEVQSGMRSVKGRVAACYERFKQPGTVQVKVTIANTGVVTKAVATGKFANTDTGACVAKAVSTATFPEYNGPSMSLSYPFLLQ